MKSRRQGVVVKTKRSTHSDRSKQHERFVRDAIARSLLTLPFAHLDANDPFGTISGYYKQLLEAASSGALPETQVLMSLVEVICQDAAIHESAGNFLKADIERGWCEGMWTYFTSPPSAAPGVAPAQPLDLHVSLTPDEIRALPQALDHVRVHMAHEHTWATRDAAMTAIGKLVTAARSTIDRSGGA